MLNNNEYFGRENYGLEPEDPVEESPHTGSVIIDRFQKFNVSGDSKNNRSLNNSKIFYLFLDKVSDLFSGGTRFHCVKISNGAFCDPCAKLNKFLSTYVDYATLQEILDNRNSHRICGYIYCNHSLPKDTLSDKGRKKSRFKIDLESGRICDRRTYESFCSTKCMDENEDIKIIVSKSLMETGVITPRAVRQSDATTLNKLLSSVINLEKCAKIPSDIHEETLSGSTENIPSEHTQARRQTEVTTIKDNLEEEQCIMFDYGTVERLVRFSDQVEEEKRDEIHDTESEKGPPPVPTKISHCSARKEQKPDALFGSLETINDVESYESTDSDDFSLQKQESESENLSPKGYDSYKSLGLLSVLWYTLNTSVTQKTRDFLASGIVETELADKLQGRAKMWYDECVKNIPKELLLLLDKPLRKLLSTFRFGSNTPKPNAEYETILAKFLIYVILRNVHHISSESLELETPHTNSEREADDLRVNKLTMEQYYLDEYTSRIEWYLLNGCKLDKDSIGILEELLLQE